MLIETVLSLRPKPVNYDDQPYRVIEEKADGMRITVLTTTNGITAVSRRAGIEYWPRMTQCIKGTETYESLVALPVGTVVDGELVAGNFASDVPSALARGLPMTFHPFAIPYYEFKPIRDWSVHTGLLAALFPSTRIRRIEVPATVTTQFLLERARKERIEGYVLKLLPWSNWYKLKPTDTFDCVVLAIAPGTGKHEGRMGSLVVGQYDSSGEMQVVGRVGGGFSDVERETIGAQDIGRVCEVLVDSLLSNGGFRFPRFVRWRDDKPPEECRK